LVLLLERRNYFESLMHMPMLMPTIVPMLIKLTLIKVINRLQRNRINLLVFAFYHVRVEIYIKIAFGRFAQYSLD